MNNKIKKELPPKYDPKGLEEKWYDIWIKNRFFSYKFFKDYAEKEKFSMVIPPPNVTGSLHLGHALNHTIQDVLVRYNRMLGKTTLWLPGTDHAGIATQNVVEKSLKEEGLNRNDIGRKAFEKKVWEWRQKSGSTITHQQRQLGESADWDQERFTMDPGLNQLVKYVFIKLYQEKLIYRADRMIHWCPVNQTALSNIEVEHKIIRGHLYYIKYNLKDEDQFLTIATTRPETILGDEAIAVHPQDERYISIIGKKVFVPLIHKEIPIISDTYVDMKFGTGVLKVTPAHDPNDFEVGKRHHLPLTRIMDDSARINEAGGPYAGLSREKARDKIVKDLKEKNLLEKIEKYTHNVGHSHRSGAIVEPLPSTQWFVATQKLAEPAIQAVQLGKIHFIPKRWENTYFSWMNEIQDWCISRQLWWGHQIPAWYDQDGRVYVGFDEEDVRKKYDLSRDTPLEQDEDVLDTWFSSALWPFATLWDEKDLMGIRELPKLSKKHEMFYPTNILITGFDIIFFWVARMIMMGIHLIKDVPFRQVYVHGLVRDTDRQKMSKSKGNVIDPLKKMEVYGTDSFRFFLISILPEGKDIVYDESRLKGYQAFCNKIWNTARYIWMNQELNYSIENKEVHFSEMDTWIINRFNDVLIKINRAIENCKFAEYGQLVYDFVWKSFCDHYIELSKISLKYNSQKENTIFTLNLIFCNILKILHPIMPFITEELYSYWEHNKNDLIIVSRWPQEISIKKNEKDIENIEMMINLIHKIRNLKGELSIPISKKQSAFLVTQNKSIQSFFKEHSEYIKILARLNELQVYSKENSEISQNIHTLLPFGRLYLDIGDSIDREREKKRLSKEFQKLSKEIEGLSARLQNKNFLDKAPRELILQEKERHLFLKQKTKEIKKLTQKI